VLSSVSEVSVRRKFAKTVAIRIDAKSVKDFERLYDHVVRGTGVAVDESDLARAVFSAGLAAMLQKNGVEPPEATEATEAVGAEDVEEPILEEPDDRPVDSFIEG